jgi:hypothetical protein
MSAYRTGEAGSGIGIDAIVPSGKIGLGTGPNEESKPLRLMMTRVTALP